MEISRWAGLSLPRDVGWMHWAVLRALPSHGAPAVLHGRGWGTRPRPCRESLAESKPHLVPSLQFWVSPCTGAHPKHE